MNGEAAELRRRVLLGIAPDAGLDTLTISEMLSLLDLRFLMLSTTGSNGIERPGVGGAGEWNVGDALPNEAFSAADTAAEPFTCKSRRRLT